MYVEVVINREPEIRLRGLLVALTEEGEATLIIDGVRRYCWPVLEIREIPRPEVDS